MVYKEFIPVPDLSKIVKCIWILEGDHDLRVRDFQKILPDGSAELIFHYGESPLQSLDAMEFRQDSCFLYGQISRFIEIKTIGKTGTIGIKFQPWGLAWLTDIPQYELRDQRTGIQDLFPKADRGIHQKILETSGIDEKIQLVQQFLLDIIKTRSFKKTSDLDGLSWAVHRLGYPEGYGSVYAVARELNLSIRELQRRFRENIGLSPQKLAAIYQFQSIFGFRNQPASLTVMAHAAGYYDQSHFIRSFQKITGTNPQSFFKAERTLTDFFVSKS